MLITKSQVEQVIKPARKAHSFSSPNSSNAGEGLDEISNPPKDEQWLSRQERKEYLMGLEYPQLIELTQLMSFGREWHNRKELEDFFTSIDEHKNEYLNLPDKELAVHHLMGKKYLSDWLQEALKHCNLDNN